MYQALYRKWRPKDFDSVYGQEHITTVLKHEVRTNKCSHAYLFCGSRGTGKTSCARIFAKAMTCLSPKNGNPCCECANCVSIDTDSAIDIIEIDAASYTGVDNIRSLREDTVYVPSVLSKKIYIIDEAHMLSSGASNALLKTLEEPPSHVVFILATTELHKISSTIASRCQKFEFRRISVDNIAKRLQFIAEQEGISISEDATRMIARVSQGGMRDAIMLMELCASNEGEITVDYVKKIAGYTGREQANLLVKYIAQKDVSAVLEMVDTVVSSTKDLSVFWQEVMDYYREMLVFKAVKNAKRLLDLTDSENSELAKVAENFKGHTLLRHCTLLQEAFLVMNKANVSKRICAEMTLLKMCDDTLDPSLQSLVSRISAIEEKLASSNIPQSNSNSNTTMYQKSVEVEQKAEKTQVNIAKNIVKREGMKPIKWWVEVVNKLDQKDFSLSSWLKKSKAYFVEDKITVRVVGKLAVNILNSQKSKNALIECINIISKENFSPDKLEFIEVETIDDNDDPISSLVEQTQGDE